MKKKSSSKRSASGEFCLSAKRTLLEFALNANSKVRNCCFTQPLFAI